MPVLKYWDVAQGAYVSIPGSPGPGGLQGVTGPTGSVPTDNPFGRYASVKIGSVPAAGTTLKLFAQTYVVTTTQFATAALAIPAGMFSTGYVAVAMMADATPYNQLGLTLQHSQCSLTAVGVMVWHGGTIIQNAQVRVNVIALGA